MTISFGLPFYSSFLFGSLRDTQPVSGLHVRHSASTLLTAFTEIRKIEG
jgi:hypothetical protein